MNDISSKRQQVADQCKVVAHLSRAITEIYSDMERIFRSTDSGPDDIVEIVGARTSLFMEELGDMLNAVDGCTEEDDWTAPIFEAAQKLWPVDGPPAVAKAGGV